MHCPNCGNPLAEADRFCGACGAPRPTAEAAPRTSSAAESRSQEVDWRFMEAEAEYAGLAADLALGRITRQQLEERLRGLMFQDHQGRYWSLGVDDGAWYVYDGQSWTRADPVASGATAPPPPPEPTVSPDVIAKAKEPGEFSVVLRAHGDQKITVVRILMELGGFGVKEAKDLVEAAPRPVLLGLTRPAAEAAVAQLRQAGAVAEIL